MNSSSLAVESLSVLWELTLITFRVVGVDRNKLTVADLRNYEPYRQFVLFGLLGIGLLAFGAAAWLVAVWFIPLESGPSLMTMSPFARSLATIGRACTLVSPLIWLVSGLMFRVAMQARARAIAEQEALLAPDPTLPDIEQRLEQRDAYEDALFERNLTDAFLLRSFRWSGLNFLENGEYQFASRVNVLLGKNGYGKTLLFRILAALIRRERGTIRRLAKIGNPKLKLEITRNGSTEEVLVETATFRDSVGGIPLLAIPDSRFVNRSMEAVAGSATGSEPLSHTGAKHFLTQEPYEDVIQELLTQLVLDYLSNRKGLEQPIFRLIESVVRELTDDAEFAFDSIERAGRSAYTIRMRSGANPDTPLSIQTAF